MLSYRRLKIEDGSGLYGLSPTKSHIDDAGFDVYTPVDFKLKAGSIFHVKLGLSIQCNNPSMFLLMQARSGLGTKGIITTGNVIDAGYTGDIGCTLVNAGPDNIDFKRGDRIAQVIPIIIKNDGIMEINKYEETKSNIYRAETKVKRKDKGFGSTGS